MADQVETVFRREITLIKVVPDRKTKRPQLSQKAFPARSSYVASAR